MEKRTSSTDSCEGQLLQFIYEIEGAESSEAAGGGAAAAAATPAPIEESSSIKKTEVNNETADVWKEISDALDNWLERIVDTESRYSNDQTTNIDQRIERSIERMLEDGLLSTYDAGELRFVGDSWLRLLHAYSYYSIGCTTYKQDIFSSLLDLFTAKQISRYLFIKICERV